jgi:hypothetical protein
MSRSMIFVIIFWVIALVALAGCFIPGRSDGGDRAAPHYRRHVA